MGPEYVFQTDCYFLNYTKSIFQISLTQSYIRTAIVRVNGLQGNSFLQSLTSKLKTKISFKFLAKEKTRCNDVVVKFQT